MTVNLKNIEDDKTIDSEEELRKMIQENLELTREIHQMTHKIKGYITFQKFMSVIYFLIIVVPIVLSIIYLPPLIKGMINQYESLLPAGQTDQLKKLLEGGPQNLLPKE